MMGNPGSTIESVYSSLKESSLNDNAKRIQSLEKQLMEKEKELAEKVERIQSLEKELANKVIGCNP
jgi:flagellar motility protein MotE (MotC chaperone)